MITILPVFTPKQIWKQFSSIIRYCKHYSTSSNCRKALIDNCKFLDTQYNIDYDYLMHYYVQPCLIINTLKNL